MHTIQYEKNNLTILYFKHTIRPILCQWLTNIFISPKNGGRKTAKSNNTYIKEK